jgi:hypothetical protein
MLQKELKVERVIVFLVDKQTMGVLHVLSIANINRNRAGNYQCTASNDVSSLISATVYVVVNCK